VQNGLGSGVYGSSVTNFRLKSSTVSGNGNAVLEAGVEFDGLFGTDSIISSTITGSYDDNMVVRNTSGTLDSLVVVSSTFSSNGSSGNDGLLVTASNAASATVRVRNSTFTANKGDHFQATASNSATMNVVLFQNQMTGGHPLALGQGITLANGLTHTGTFTYDINDNDILNGPISNAITISHAGTTGSVFQGRIRNNVIGTAGSALSCSTQGHGIVVDVGNRGTQTTAVTGNTVQRCFDRGIVFDAGDGNAIFNLTATGNTVTLSDPGSRDAMRIEAGAFDPNFLGSTDTFTLCAVVGGSTAAEKNTLDGGPSGEALRTRLRFNSRMNMPGYGGAYNDAAAVQTYLTGRNTLIGTVTATTTAPSAAYGYGNAASCPTPP
jgi:parallel beta-helix repeat protein